MLQFLAQTKRQSDVRRRSVSLSPLTSIFTFLKIPGPVLGRMYTKESSLFGATFLSIGCASQGKGVCGVETDRLRKPLNEEVIDARALVGCCKIRKRAMRILLVCLLGQQLVTMNTPQTREWLLWLGMWWFRFPVSCALRLHCAGCLKALSLTTQRCTGIAVTDLLVVLANSRFVALSGCLLQ